MMPDIHQEGRAETTEWQPEQKAPVILLENVSKTYGKIHALSGVTLALSGGVTGILGLNGAGKSTLFKILMGKLKPSSGQVRLFGTNPWKNPAPYSRVGFVPEGEKMHDWMTAHDFISTFARLNGLTRDEAKVEADRVLDFVGLLDVAHKQIGRFSKGMRQRTKIAHALVSDPELIILDEPIIPFNPNLAAEILLSSNKETLINFFATWKASSKLFSSYKSPTQKAGNAQILFHGPPSAPLISKYCFNLTSGKATVT